MTNAADQAAWRKRNPDRARDQRNTRMRQLRAEGREKWTGPRKTRTMPFIALDGEGAGMDRAGRQNYQLLRAGDASGKLHRALSLESLLLRHVYLPTQDCLEFILALPADAILVGYFFGYDVTMSLKDLPSHRVVDLFGVKLDRKNKYTYWECYGIEYVPKQYFRVCRIDRVTCKVIPGTSRTVNEVGGFFQKSFVEAIKDFEIGSQETVDMIAFNKDRRQSFLTIGAEESEYCRAECRLLAMLMDKFRQCCIDANIVPRHWRGAGHIAARLHEMNNTPKRKDRKRPATIDRMAEAAYYGGRFEITTIGRVKGEVWEYDINSAYPAAMLHLPCPIHGKWKKFDGDPGTEPGEIFISDCTFAHPDSAFLCSLPIREKARLYFPRMGSGIYWSVEIEAAERIGAKIKHFGGYKYIRKCECEPFRWVQELYAYRKSIGSQGKGYPIKLGINGLYGKFAQRIGAAPWQDYVMAGLITATVRAKLIDAFAQAPHDILYIATDALYSRKPLQLDIGDGLGQWGEKKRDGIFIVQPGIYWSNGTENKPKTRGIPRSIIIENKQRFENAWDNWLRNEAAGSPPVIPVFVNQFIGLRAALARGKPELAGTWLTDKRELTGDETVGIRNIDFDWKHKRKPYGDYIQGESMVTVPFNGRRTLRSEGYNGEAITEFAAQLIEREDDPDFVPWGNSGE